MDFITSLQKDAVALADESIRIIGQFPKDYVPNDIEGRSLKNYEITSILKQEKTPLINEVELNKIISGFPDGLFEIFVTCSLVVSDAANFISHYYPHIGLNKDFTSDEWIKQLMTTMTVYQSGFNSESIIGLGDLFDPYFPYEETIKTILGPEAIKWLRAPSNSQPGKIQPHELSRVNWHRLHTMTTQVKIENELNLLSRLEPIVSKVVVISLWTMKALATLMNPNIFISEAKPHITVSSSRHLTVSQGDRTHTITNYLSSSFINVLSVLKELLKIEYIEASDMIWIAANLATIRSTQQRHSEIQIAKESYDVFLSHRGKDMKKKLMAEVLRNHQSKTVFLDCLSLPYKLVNRHFVYKNLINSNRVFIVNSAYYNESEWCRKEKAVAKLLSQFNYLEYHEINEPAELSEKLNSLRQSSVKDKATIVENLPSWTVIRILRDIDDHNGPKPNLYSMKQDQYPVDIFTSTVNFLQDKNIESKVPLYSKDDIVARIDNLLDSVFALFQSNTDRSNDNDKDSSRVKLESFLAVAVQLIIGMLSLNSNSYDKMRTREYVNSANLLCKEILDLTDQEDVKGKQNTIRQLLKFMCCAVALELNEKSNINAEYNGIGEIVSEFGIYKEGLILLDVRTQNNKSGLLLHLIVEMIRAYNIGTVGILQDGESPIHNNIINNFSLEVMPCVTFYPGMAELYPYNTS